MENIKIPEELEDHPVLSQLTPYYKKLIVAYYTFARHKTEQSVKEIETSISTFETTTLLESSYTIDEVSKLFKDLGEDIQQVYMREAKYTMYTELELLKQVFLEAIMQGMYLELDVSSIEDENALKQLANFEKQLFSPKKGLGSKKLAPLGSSSMQDGEKIQSLKKQNKNIKAELRRTQEELVKANAEKKQAQLRTESFEAVVENLKNTIQTLQKDSLNVVSNSQNTHQELTNENEALKNQIKELKATNRNLQKEMTKKISQTTQVQNMKNMLKNKNEQIRELRKQVEKYVPKTLQESSGGMMASAQDSDSD